MKIYSTSKDWKKLFEENAEIFNNGLKSVSKAFAAFNANVDLIAEVSKSFPLKFNDINSSVKLPESIDTLNDLKKAIAYSFIHGQAVELKMENEELYSELLKNFRFKGRRIGGQMGIVANTLALLGVKQVIVFTNLLSNEQAELFHDNVLFPSVKNNTIIFKKAKDSGRAGDPTRVNIIIEYRQGVKMRLKDKIVTVPRNNRFIISSPITKSPPLIPKPLLRRELFAGVKRVFLSGYHHISKKGSAKIFNEWAYQLKQIKSFNKNLLIHLEYVNLHKDWLNNGLFKVLKYVDSLGCNEAEAADLMKYLGNKALHGKIIKSKYDAKLLVKAAEFLLERFKLSRVNIHTLEYIINLTRKDYPVSINRILNANIYGIRVVNSKAVAGNDFLNALKRINENPISIKGVTAAAQNYKTKYDLVITPNMSEKKVPVIYTVGLGDTVSSAIFYAEEK